MHTARASGSTHGRRVHSCGEADASHILLLLSGGAAAREGGDPGALHACLLQGLCVGIRASRARAVLSRRAAVAASTLDTTTRQIALHGAMEE